MSKLTIGRSLKIYCTFANEFKSFANYSALKHRLEFRNGEQFTIGMLKSCFA
ncbi:hypothetical protein HMPREF9554_00230 [Treponema phagedenis F0421]|nr:hypothetical protein HMPREF9554_00230 [Treponema phagedenis F0421]